ncbi:hypothetical protein SLS56_007977 [Neofusicoccum ribis]|uniref:Uncharacterized protein n=1 Tax=Neofusicoccum ribis TaxID=45134 RepID=A0ABR3SLM1_9PEZI
MSLKFSIDFPEDEEEPWIIEHRIVDILTEYLQPAFPSLPTDSALQLTELFHLNQTEQKSNPEGFLWQAWDIIFRTGEQVPHNHASQARLVALIAALRDAPTQPNPFADLKNMGPALTERLNQIRAEPPAGAQDPSPWRNLNALAARLARDAVAAISLALEGRPHPRSRAYRSRDVALNFHVPIAADWVLECAREIYGEMGLGEEGGGGPWKGKRGVSVER